MIKLKRILVPTDFSDNSRLALEYAAELGERFESELYLLHVLQDVLPVVAPEPGLVFASAGDFVDDLRKSAEDAMQKLVESKPLAGKKVVHHVGQGQPFVEIIRYARDKSVDLIVIGTHGRTGLAHVLMGSVAERVVRKAGCPVLTVRPAGHKFIMP
jgi:nucleotide-binding universal stress UspA family protein